MRSLHLAVGVTGAVLLTGGCIYDAPPDNAEVVNRTHADVVVRIVGSGTEIAVPGWSGRGFGGHDDCVGDRLDVVAEGLVIASFAGGMCPTSMLTLWEDGRITMSDRGTTRTPLPAST